MLQTVQKSAWINVTYFNRLLDATFEAALTITMERIFQGNLRSN